MVFGHIISSQPRGGLSAQQSLHLANFFLGGAGKEQDRDIALALCHETEITLFQAKKSAKRSDDQSVQHGIAIAYIGLGKVLDSHEHRNEAQAIYKKAEKMGVKIQDQAQLTPFVDSTKDPLVAQPPPPTSQTKHNQGNIIASIPPLVFSENVRPTTAAEKLPEPDERLANTPQLACCLALLKDFHSLDDILEPAARNWLQVVENDEDEQERLKVLATDVVRTFKKEEIKDAKAVSEVVCLVPVLEKDTYRDLLMDFYDGIDHSGLLDFHQLEGLAQMIQGADPEYLHADDLVKILGLLTTRLQNTHKQSPQHMFKLILAASYVLDAMADTCVTGLDRETLHLPLMSYLDSLKGSSDPFMMYQVAYAYQALLCVPDNETLWQATLRRTTKVIRGVSGLVSAVKGLDLNGFLDGLKDIQQGIAGASEMVKTIVTVFNDVSELTAGGRGFLKGLKEGLSFQRKCAWYPALRGADTFIRDGDFIAFKQLVSEAPCRLDLAFQWGVCQRLGEIAINQTWDARTRRSATVFLGEIYRNTEDWGDQTSVKEWIVIILNQVASSTGSTSQFARSLVQELETYTDAKRWRSLQESLNQDPDSYPLRVALPALGSPSLLDRVQNKPDVEGNLRLLRKQRLKERGIEVFIQPQAKSSLQASDDSRFPLMEKVKEFLDSDQGVFLLLGDSGAGKSTFTRHLEYDLWQDYKKNTGRIPLHINLPAIDKPEQDMIAKHLRKSEFTEPEIRELKTHRRLILICDGYDESQQTHNLYMSNRLNQTGEWNAQMIVSCRSEYLGVDYRDRFQPGDRNRPSESGKFQEAVITPFSEDQVNDYIKQYVSVHQPLWDASQYTQALDLIPSLKDLVKNPFLMTLSLEVLPRMMDPGEHLSATRVTRVALYDQFIEHWLERGKKRLGEKELTPQAKSAFESLVEEGFTRNGIDFMKKLAVAIYKEQRGQPIVQYSRFKDEGTWKAAFFSQDEKQLLREAIPLTRSGNQHRFIHRSLLEYGLALAIFDPQDWKERTSSTLITARRGSTDSTLSFQSVDLTKDVLPSIEHSNGLSSPLAWKNICNDPSILEFLKERVQQEPMFKQQLLNCIEHSKTDVSWRKAAANAMTILLRAGEQFIGADLRGIKIPGADLSYGMFDSAQLQGADLRHVNLRNVWLRQADLSGAVMTGSHVWEGPYFKEDSAVYSCAYSPDGRSLAVGLETGDIRMYSTSTWEPGPILEGHTMRVWSVKYSPSGIQLASCSGDSTIRLWDVEHGKCIRTMTGHEGEVNCVAFSPCASKIVSAADDRTVRMWDVGTGECRFILIGHTSFVMSVTISPYGKQIASGSFDTTVRIWDSDTGESQRVLEGHTGLIQCVAYSPQGDRIAFSDTDGTVRLLDLSPRGTCRILTGHTGGIWSVAFSPRGDLVASSGADRTIRLWNTETGDCLQVLTGHASIVYCVVFSPTSDHIASASVDKTVRLWVIGSGANYQASSNRCAGVSNVKYSSKGNQFASSHEDGTIRLWDAKTGVHYTLSGHSYSVTRIDYLDDGDLLVSENDIDAVRLWDVETRECRQKFTPNHDNLDLVTYSPRESRVASSGLYGSIKIWDMKSGECTHILIGQTCWSRSLAFSPDGNRIISVVSDSTVRLWDIQAGICLHIMQGCSVNVMHAAFSPRGDVVASISLDGTMHLWDTESGACRIIIFGHSDYGLHVNAYSPLGNQVSSGSKNGTLRLWDVDTGDCIHTMTGHTDMITSVKYNPDGRWIASGSEDKSVRLWDVASGHCLTVIQELNGSIKDIAWDPAPDIRRFIAGVSDGSIQSWQVEEDDGQYNIRLCWGTAGDELVVSGASIQGVRGLSRFNMRLLEQRGAVGEPLDGSREAIKKVINMATVVSRFKQNSRDVPSGSTLSIDPVDEQSEQQEVKPSGQAEPETE